MMKSTHSLLHLESKTNLVNLKIIKNDTHKCNSFIINHIWIINRLVSTQL